MSPDDFIARLSGVQRTASRGWVAKCPSHDDKQPSLSVGVNDDGTRLLLNCHTGCTVGEIVKAMGLRLRDLFLDPDDQKRLPPPDDDGRKPDDWDAAVRQWVSDATPSLIESLARSLGVSEQALRRMETGYRLGAYTFPERDGTGKIIGAATRVPGETASKKFVAGGHRGIVLPEGWQNWLKDSVTPIWLVEGASDVAAMLTMGLRAFGRPSNVGGVEHLTTLLGNAECPIYVVGENDEKWDSSKQKWRWEGFTGARKTARELAVNLEREVFFTFPPDQQKDVREALIARAPAKPENIGSMLAAILIGNRYSTVAAPELNVANADRIAAEFLATNHTTLGHKTLGRHNEKWIEHSGARWQDIGEEQFTARVRVWVGGQNLYRVNVKGEHIPAAVSRNLINEVLEAIKARVILPTKMDVPSWYPPTRKAPDPEEIIPFKNGLLNIRTGELLAHSPRYFSPFALPYRFNPRALAPEWDRFLTVVSAGDEGWVKSLQLWFGYMLLPTNREQRAAVFFGPIRSGKGTIMRALERLVGAENVANSTLVDLSTQFGRAPLIGKQAVLVGDAHLSIRHDGTRVVETLKSIIGGDSQTVDVKRELHWTGPLKCKFVLAMDSLPMLPDSNSSLIPKFLIWPFVQSFFGREDRDLESRLIAEQEGIAAWAIRGAQEYIRVGKLAGPTRGREVTDRLARLASPIRCFVDEVCVMDPDSNEAIPDIFAAWAGWCAKTKHSPGTLGSFGARIRDLLPHLPVQRSRVDGGRENRMVGIKIDRTRLDAVANYSGNAGYVPNEDLYSQARDEDGASMEGVNP